MRRFFCAWSDAAIYPAFLAEIALPSILALVAGIVVAAKKRRMWYTISREKNERKTQRLDESSKR